MELLQRPLTALAGVGGHTAARLGKLGLATVGDLIWHLPARYEDRTRVCPLGDLAVGAAALVRGQVGRCAVTAGARKNLLCALNDGTGELWLRFFKFTASQLQQLANAGWVSAFAEVRAGFYGLEMVHPDYAVLSHPDADITEPHLTPVYPLADGVGQKTLRKAIAQALGLCRQQAALVDWLPDELLRRHGLPPLVEAVWQLHAPAADADLAAALRRLAFEELLAHHLRLRAVKERARRHLAPVFASPADAPGHLAARFLAELPFELTAAQRRVIAEIEADCRRPRPMLRLLQGDVGCGKTVVAAYAALLALAGGHQVALMAPTELLARQHERNLGGWFAGLGVSVGLLTGQLKGKAKAGLLEAVAEGRVGLVLGTHALFQAQVRFQRLGLVIIDEQHRFGVDQRLSLREKAQAAGVVPHQLVMTATPIPRTLAMVSHADLDLSVIDQLPPGRRPPTTCAIPAHRRGQVIGRLRRWLDSGRQAYWVCTLIEDSEQRQCEAVERTARLLAEALPAVAIAVLHGRMGAKDKDAAMDAFKAGRTALLVATTVVEVGVDVANAGLMVIENPERLGLAQLHQLRGRVGRGGGDSYCLLLYQAPLSAVARRRLGALRASNDGFVIAEQDLKLRGQGEVLGTRQTGLMRFKVADLGRDADLFDAVRAAADDIFARHPSIVRPLCERWLGADPGYCEV